MHRHLNVERLESRFLLSGSGYTFKTIANFNDAGLKNPTGTLIQDSSGDIFGVANGGANSHGAVWELPAGSPTITVLASFDGATNGSNPSGIVFDNEGDLVGLCNGGGANDGGTLWEIHLNSPSTIDLLGSFNGPTTGGSPSGQIYVDSSNNLFGTTQGTALGESGSIWKYSASGQTITALVHFTQSGENGANPFGGVISNGNGILYGTTENGGSADEGVIFSYTIGASSDTVLANFDGTTNGGNPQGGIAMDSSGDLFGTSFGNINTSNLSNVWELTSGSSTISTLHFFARKSAIFFGADPSSPVSFDSNGNLFGAAEFGGATNQGDVFEVPKSTGTFTDLYSFNFSGPNDPASSLLVDSHGDIFGTTQLGGTKRNGALFELIPPGNVVPTHEVFSVQPTNTQANGDFSANVSVTIEGAGNKVAGEDDSAVTLTVNKGPGTLGGTTTVNAVNGVATFSGLTLNAAGNYTLKATSGSLKPIISRLFMVPTVAQLTIAQQPTDVAAGSKMTTPMVVDVKDQFGNLLTTNHTVVKAAIVNPPAGVKLLGGTAVVTHGAATFKNLVVKSAGTFTLTLTDGKLTPLTTSSFTVS